MQPLLPTKPYGFIAHTGANRLASPSQPPASVIHPAQYQAKVDFFRRKHGLPGLAVAVINADTCHYLCSGRQRVDAPALLQASDYLPLGALSKAVTATLLARWVEQGKLRWDSTLAELLPAWRTQMRTEFQAVTILHLLQHRAGLARDVCDLNYPQLLVMLGGHPSADRSTAVRWILQQAPLGGMNHRAHYSNLGYLIADFIIELLGGNTYQRIVQEQLFSPLAPPSRLNNPSPVSGHHCSKTHWFSQAYWRRADDNDEAQQLAQLKPTIRLSLAEYSAFLREHLRGLRGASSLLSLRSFQQLHTPSDYYALGWACVQSTEYGSLSIHDSAEHGYRHYSLLMPASQRAVAIFCNGDQPRSGASLVQLAESLIS